MHFEPNFMHILLGLLKPGTDVLYIRQLSKSEFNVHGSVHCKYILIYSYIQQDAMLHSLFIYFWKVLYMFRVVSPLNIRSTYNCIYSIWHLQVPDAVDTVVCTPDDEWRYHPKHVEHFPEINK